MGLTKQLEWISIEDKLPTEDIYVLVYLREMYDDGECISHKFDIAKYIFCLCDLEGHENKPFIVFESIDGQKCYYEGDVIKWAYIPDPDV